MRGSQCTMVVTTPARQQPGRCLSERAREPLLGIAGAGTAAGARRRSRWRCLVRAGANRRERRQQLGRCLSEGAREPLLGIAGAGTAAGTRRRSRWRCLVRTGADRRERRQQPGRVVMSLRTGRRLGRLAHRSLELEGGSATATPVLVGGHVIRLLRHLVRANSAHANSAHANSVRANCLVGPVSRVAR